VEIYRGIAGIIERLETARETGWERGGCTLPESQLIGVDTTVVRLTS
jgi:hypothetical protein